MTLRSKTQKMRPKVEKEPAKVIEVDISDDEANDGAGATPTNNKSTSQQQSSVALTPVSSNKNLVSQSFWKAGAYDVGPTTRPPLDHGCFSIIILMMIFDSFFSNCNFFIVSWNAGQLEHARVHPKFLHSNATSHKWAFGGKL